MRLDRVTVTALAATAAVLVGAELLHSPGDEPPSGLAGAADRAPPACRGGEVLVAGTCVPFLGREAAAVEAGFPSLATNYHLLNDGRAEVYDYMPAPTDAPDFTDFAYPLPEPFPIVSRFDLALPDPEQRREPGMQTIGHGGVDVLAPRGTPVVTIALRGEVLPAIVLFTGTLFGQTVITYHRVLRAGESYRFVALHGHLDAIASAVGPGVPAPPGTILGAVGSTGVTASPPHLHYELRWIRDGVDLQALEGGRVLDANLTVPVDPRNLLPALPR